MVDLRKQRLRPIRGVDLDHVKAGLQFASCFHQPHFRRRDEAALLGVCDKFPGFAEVRVLALLNFYKSDDLTLAGDDVDFSLTAAEIALHDPVAVQAQIAGGAILAPVSALLLLVHPYSFLRKLMRWMGEGPNSRRAS